MSVHHVVVALDDSPASRAALIRGRTLLARGGTLHFIHVIDSAIVTTAPRHSTPKAMDDYRRQRELEARGMLETAAQETRASGLAVEIDVRVGNPVEEVLASVSQTGAELLAVGAHGKNVFERLVLGSVAEALARRSAVPTLVTREHPQQTGHIERVFVAIDLSETSREAARVAATVSQHLGKPLEAVHVIDVRGLPLEATGDFTPGVSSHEAREAVEAAPRLVGFALSEAGVKTAAVRVLAGNPNDELTKYATPSDLIVCGTHGRGALGRIVFGSVALHLLRHAPCPVIVVRPPSV